jgi:hypothetical protein
VQNFSAPHILILQYFRSYHAAHHLLSNKKEMASIEEVRQELAKAQKKLDEAKAAVQEFKGRYGKHLMDLENKLWGSEGTAAEQAEWKEKAKLEEKEKRLEVEVTRWREDVRKCREALIAAPQTGNDFVTQALGTQSSVYLG